MRASEVASDKVFEREDLVLLDMYIVCVDTHANITHTGMQRE